jgi:acyl-coenzyme A synthetase/AMP-(fatty) acid ligase
VLVFSRPAAGSGYVQVAELQEHCKSRLQRFQYPHMIEFVSELPKTVTGKIQRYKLRDKEAAPA